MKAEEYGRALGYSLGMTISLIILYSIIFGFSLLFFLSMIFIAFPLAFFAMLGVYDLMHFIDDAWEKRKDEKKKRVKSDAARKKGLYKWVASFFKIFFQNQK